MDKAAAIVAGTSSGAVHAAVLERGVITVYSRQKNYERLPATLKNWIFEVVNNARVQFGEKIAVRYH